VVNNKNTYVCIKHTNSSKVKIAKDRIITKGVTTKTAAELVEVPLHKIQSPIIENNIWPENILANKRVNKLKDFNICVKKTQLKRLTMPYI